VIYFFLRQGGRRRRGWRGGGKGSYCDTRGKRAPPTSAYEQEMRKSLHRERALFRPSGGRKRRRGKKKKSLTVAIVIGEKGGSSPHVILERLTDRLDETEASMPGERRSSAHRLSPPYLVRKKRETGREGRGGEKELPDRRQLPQSA